MKTLEELRLLSPAQLKGIAQSLGVEPPKLDYRKHENREKLVMLVYDVQQPEASVSEEAEKTVKFDDTPPPEHLSIDEKIAILEETWGARLREVGENDDGVTIFSVVDAADDEFYKGTFLELWDIYLNTQSNNALQDIPLSEEPEDPAAVPEVSTGDPGAVEKALTPLRRTGLNFEVIGGAVKLQYGSKTVTTTINQPLHRVVRVAEQLCRVL